METSDTPKFDPGERAFKFDARDRLAAHQALDRWLDECETEGETAWADGRSGYIGRIKLCAFVNDDGVSLRVERSLSEDL